MSSICTAIAVSPYQNHELMRQICEQIDKYGECTAILSLLRRVSLACTWNYCGCVFRRRTAIASAKEEKAGRRAGVRRKSRFRRNPTEILPAQPLIKRTKDWYTLFEQRILYHVLAPVAQLDRALDSDSKGHAFESHRAYHVKPLVSLKRAVFLCFLAKYKSLQILGRPSGRLIRGL